MDHAEATQMRAVERYMLADLSVCEVEDFERHFFDCPQCSEELRTLSILRENARAVFIEQASTPSISNFSGSEQPVTQQASGRAGRIPRIAIIAAALAILALAMFFGYEIGKRKTGNARPVNAYPLYAAICRASRIGNRGCAASECATLHLIYGSRPRSRFRLL